MADPVTSGIKGTEIGEGKDKKTIYTATKVTVSYTHLTLPTIYSV